MDDGLAPRTDALLQNLTCNRFVGARDVDGSTKLRWAEHLVFAVDGYFGNASGDGPGFGAVAMPLVGEAAALGLDT